jgi:hypothetical protein
MEQITFNGYHLPTLAKLARDLGRPTCDAFAEFIWHFTSSEHGLPVPLAKQFMAAAGYKPFVGLPLQHAA